MVENNNIFKIFQGDLEPYSLDNTIDYGFKDKFRGKFIYVPSKDITHFVVIGGKRLHFVNIKHRNIKDFLEVISSETAILDVEAAGYLAIHPDQKTIVFYGDSEAFKKGFDRKHIIPVAQYIAKKTKGKIETAIIASGDDEIQKGLIGVITPPDSALGCAFHELGGGESYYVNNRRFSFFIETLGYAKALESMVIDLKNPKK